MTAVRTSPGTSEQAWEYERDSTGGVLVGVDGSPRSIAALNAAAAIARTRRVPMHALTVLSPFPYSRVDSRSGTGSDSLSELRRALRESELREVFRVLEPEPGWTCEAVLGTPAREIIGHAERRGADLIVVGRHRHGKVDQLLGGETTLQVMRSSPVPVLAVESELDVPTTVVAAVDFSISSRRAAMAAAEMMTGSGTIHLVYVEPFGGDSDSPLPVDLVTSFRRLADSLRRHPGILVETVVLTGKPVSAVIQFAERVGADLITAGSHGHGKVERFILGSVSTGFVRNASCAVLVVPLESQVD